MADPGTTATTTETPPPAASVRPEVVARQAEFARLESRGAATGATSLESLRDVPITITARLGHTVLPIGEILKLGPGSVIELEESVGHAIELTVRGVPFATGEVVVVDEHFAIRIKSLLPPRPGKGEL
jgi:flagellar motor switch protein FliN/FliY